MNLSLVASQYINAVKQQNKKDMLPSLAETIVAITKLKPM